MFVPGYCKSAGTLLALGARELVIADAGELGPLDVQMTRKDEIFDTQSGLTAPAAVSTLNTRAFEAFEKFMLNFKLKAGPSVTTRAATDLATQLTCGLFAGIYQRIDPMHIGEAGRAMDIARKYGQILMSGSRNFSDASLDKLVSEYPSHGFIIDRQEAKKIFEHVREPSNLEESLPRFFGSGGHWPIGSTTDPLIGFLSTELPEKQTETTTDVTDDQQRAERRTQSAEEHTEDAATAGGSCIAPGFLDSGLTVFAARLPRPARRGRVAPARGCDSRTSPASTGRCTFA